MNDLIACRISTTNKKNTSLLIFRYKWHFLSKLYGNKRKIYGHYFLILEICHKLCIDRPYIIIIIVITI